MDSLPTCTVVKLQILKSRTDKNQIKNLAGSPKEWPLGKSLTEHPVYET